LAECHKSKPTQKTYLEKEDQRHGRGLDKAQEMTTDNVDHTAMQLLKAYSDLAAGHENGSVFSAAIHHVAEIADNAVRAGIPKDQVIAKISNDLALAMMTVAAAPSKMEVN
jgi:hypothetical protein